MIIGTYLVKSLYTHSSRLNSGENSKSKAEILLELSQRMDGLGGEPTNNLETRIQDATLEKHLEVLKAQVELQNQEQNDNISQNGKG